MVLDARDGGRGDRDRAPLIELREVGKVYQRRALAVTVLQDISIEVASGEFVAVIGPSGSGKSTLMYILGCLTTPTHGRYSLEGRDVTQLSDDALSEMRARRIGFVFQDFALLPQLTALENVALPMTYAGAARSDRDHRAKAALERVGLTHRASHRPPEMSGGEQQRVAIARALINDPPFVLADEPTGNLDTRRRDEILEILHTLHGDGKTVVLITHDLEVAAHARRTLKMRDGTIVADEHAPGAAAAGP
ncbi:MAG: ABC transporter ATP-binding protein [Candidatus Dormibacteria bacterium]